MYIMYFSDIFTDQQLFIVFEFADGGKDVESAKVNYLHMYSFKNRRTTVNMYMNTICLTSSNNTQKHDKTFMW